MSCRIAVGMTLSFIIMEGMLAGGWAQHVTKTLSPIMETPPSPTTASPTPGGNGFHPPGLSSPVNPPGNQNMPPPSGPAYPARAWQAATPAAAVGNGDNLMIILDISFSMNERLTDGEPKIVVAKRVILDTLRQLPPTTNVGLRIYGYSASPLNGCSATKRVVPLGINNRAVIATEILGLKPTGETPISLSLQQSIQQDFVGASGRKTILLVTDGAETCDADPCRVAVQQVRTGAQVTINTVSLGLARDYAAQKQLRCVSSATYGRFYNANTAAEFADRMREAVNTHVQAQILPGR